MDTDALKQELRELYRDGDLTLMAYLAEVRRA